MVKLNWKAFIFYFNFLNQGNSIEELKIAAQAYAEAARRDNPQADKIQTTGDTREEKCQKSFLV